MNTDFPAPRRPTRPVLVGGVAIGGGAPVSVQSMTNTPTHDAPATIDQIQALAAAGCQIVRLAVPDERGARALPAIRAAVKVPLVADIHFSYRLALAALDAGVDKLRLNPGNLDKPEQVREVARAAAARNIPIRIGVNAGSLPARFPKATPEAMTAAAEEHLALLAAEGFTNTVISLKTSSVPATIAAYRHFSATHDHPLHIGVTEAGTLLNSSVASALGIGILLAAGIGDTLRVSITGDPLREVTVGRKILQHLGLRAGGVKVIACPTCGRTQVELEPLAAEIEEQTAGLTADLTVAIMGCAVNGPGEARHADVGLAGENGRFVLFRRGEIVGRFAPTEAKARLLDEIAKLAGAHQ